MTIPTKPTLDDSAKRNPAVAPDRVRRFQQVVKALQDRGVLQPSRYGLEPPRATIAIWTEGTEQPQRLLVGDPIEQTQSRYGRIEGRQMVVRLPEIINELIATPEPAAR